jgi:hypothetical protein
MHCFLLIKMRKIKSLVKATVIKNLGKRVFIHTVGGNVTCYGSKHIYLSSQQSHSWESSAEK